MRVPELDLSALSCEEVIDLTRLLEKGEKNWSRWDRRRRKEIMAKLVGTNYPAWAHHWSG
jgi:hypothetical protein